MYSTRLHNSNSSIKCAIEHILKTFLWYAFFSWINLVPYMKDAIWMYGGVIIELMECGWDPWREKDLQLKVGGDSCKETEVTKRPQDSVREWFQTTSDVPRNDRSLSRTAELGKCHPPGIFDILVSGVSHNSFS